MDIELVDIIFGLISINLIIERLLILILELNTSKFRNGFALLMTFSLIVVSCSVFSGTAPDKLDGTKWILLFIRKSTPISGRNITIQFEGGQVRGSSGCNTYFGEYKSKGAEISFSQLAATEMACLDPQGIMEQEQDYLAFLSEVVAYSIEGDRLILKKSGQDQLTFLRAFDD